jgi:hypothetical protein
MIFVEFKKGKSNRGILKKTKPSFYSRSHFFNKTQVKNIRFSRWNGIICKMIFLNQGLLAMALAAL